MGQQQLLLLLLSLLIVGVALIGGIEMFNQSSRQSQADDVLNRNVRLAQEAVNWRARAALYGGSPQGTYDPLAEGGFETMGVDPALYATSHAILSASGRTLEIVGVSTSAPGVGAYVRLLDDEVVETRVALDGSITLAGISE